MNKLIRTQCVAAAVALALQGCAGVESRESNAALEEARQAYQSASANPHVNERALVVLQNSEDALRQAEQELQQGNIVVAEHYAYLARQRALTAEELGMQEAAQQTIRNASRERDSILIEARTREAEMARMRAERQQQSAAEAQQSAEAQRREAEQMRLAAERERQRALQLQAIAQQNAQAAEQARYQAQTSEEKAAALEQQLNELQAQQTERGMVLTLGDVLFDTDEADLKPGAMRSLDKLADFLKDNPEQQVLVEGHTDSRGSEQYNLSLSERRAEAVQEALVERGVPETRVSAEGMGESYPVANNNTRAGRQENRRVELVFPQLGNNSAQNS